MDDLQQVATLEGSFLIVLGVIFLMIALVGAGIGWLLYRTGTLPHPGPIVVSLSMLTALAIVVGVINSSAELLTIAATGVGALAGAMSAVYRDSKEPPAASNEADKENDDAPSP